MHHLVAVINMQIGKNVTIFYSILAMGTLVYLADFESLKITVEWMNEWTMIKHPITHSIANAMHVHCTHTFIVQTMSVKMVKIALHMQMFTEIKDKQNPNEN